MGRFAQADSIIPVESQGVQAAACTPGWHTPRESLLAARLLDHDHLKTMGE